jgi:hypothetical protein
MIRTLRRFWEWLRAGHSDWRPTSGDMMCRKINGVWQYRRQTEEERYDEWSGNQW